MKIYLKNNNSGLLKDKKMFRLPPASEEQQAIIQSLNKGNVLSDAVAGSGKTTTILHVAQSFPDFDVLVLTYNKRLKFETRSKADTLDLENLQVHSFHSFCVKWYDPKCYTDHEINEVLKEKKKPRGQIYFQIIIIDEAQDLTPLYYELILKINKENYHRAKFCVLGDHNQSIFSFNGSDERIMLNIPSLLPSEFEWEKLYLSTSYRLTRSTASFINDCILHQERIKVIEKKDFEVEYYICNSFGGDIHQKIIDLLGSYSPSDIFILAATVKASKDPKHETPIRTLANNLTKNGIPIHVPGDDNQKLDDDILRGKMVFSTFHQVKGLERKVTIVFGFDDTYFRFFKKDSPQDVVPNELYVAITRSLEILILIQDEGNAPLPFLDLDEVRKKTKFIEPDNYQYKNPKKKKVKSREESVTGLIKYVPWNIICECFNFFSFKQTQGKEDYIDIPIKTNQRNLVEYVADLNGIAIAAYCEFKKTGKMTIDRRDDMFKVVGSKKEVDLSLESELTPSKLLRIANNYMASNTRFHFRIAQIKSYKWLSQGNLNKCLKRMHMIGPNSQFEVPVNWNLKGKTLSGLIDCIDNKVLYEFKCTKDVEKEHYIQCALYMYLCKVNEMEVDKFLLFNILTGEIFEIESDLERLEKMVAFLFEHKFSEKVAEIDEVLLEKLKEIQKRY